jgi:gamma-glutamylcyclotransferase (GGCT)/AIG2-like uncharacterized protein YtfP
MLANLFVYGTLRPESAYPMARRLQAQAKLLGRASARGILYDFGRYPGALFQPEHRDRILGHVLALRNAERLLKELDAYEGITDPASGFRRLEIEVRLEKGGRIDAWAYGLSEPPARARRIGSGDFIAHVRSGTPRPLRS